MKKAFDWYAYAVGNKDTRQVLRGVYCHNGKFVVSNAHIMIGRNHFYPERYEGKSVLRDGSIMGGIYPKYTDILKDFKSKFSTMEKVTIDLDRFDEICKEVGRKKSDKESAIVKCGKNYYKFETFKLYVDFIRYCGKDYLFQDKDGLCGANGFVEDDCFCLLMTMALAPFDENVMKDSIKTL